MMSKYRVTFLNELYHYLGSKSIKLDVIHGQPSNTNIERADTVTLEWGTEIKNRVIRIGGKQLYWQPCLRMLRGADLVITEQANKLLVNYVLLAWQQLGGPRVALWGHGANFRAGADGVLDNAVRRRLAVAPHWWFAYTRRSAAIVESYGYPAERITTVQNAVDTRTLVKLRQSVKSEELDSLRQRLGMAGRNVGVYCGGLCTEKRLDFLLGAAEHLRLLVPDFELLVIGGGPLKDSIEQAARKHGWIHYVGPEFGPARVAYFMLAKVMLLPASVGLAVLDSFALGTPLVTIENEGHGPEIDYLRHGKNGLLLDQGTDELGYARAVADLLSTPSRLNRIRISALEDAQQYTVEEMVRRFGNGVIRAMEHGY